jgi:hypothetical protein
VQPAFRYLLEISRLARQKNRHLHAHRVDDPRYINRLGARSAGCTHQEVQVEAAVDSVLGLGQIPVAVLAEIEMVISTLIE